MCSECLELPNLIFLQVSIFMGFLLTLGFTCYAMTCDMSDSVTLGHTSPNVLYWREKLGFLLCFWVELGFNSLMCKV